jgi:hypothetical protein
MRETVLLWARMRAYRAALDEDAAGLVIPGIFLAALAVLAAAMLVALGGITSRLARRRRS